LIEVQMIPVVSLARRIGNHVIAAARTGLRPVLWGGAALALAACEPVSMPGRGGVRVDPSRPVTVALLVPGGSADQGRNVLAASLEAAARMAVADLSGVQIDLRVYSTAGNPAQAAQLAMQAVNDGARIILGPVFADEANAVGSAVAARDINVLAFSNNADIAGGNVFILGPTFQNTAQRLMNFAAAQGRGQIMIVGENTAEGQVAAAAIQAAAARSQARVVATETYDFSQQGVVDALPRISQSARSSGAQTLFFTANTAGALPILAQLLPDNRVGPPTFQFMGLTRWDIPAATLQLRGLQEGWFALPDPTMAARFEARYTATNGQAPHPIAGLAYDGIAAIGALLASGQAEALTQASLTQAQGFAGVTGIFRLRADGTNERGLAVATIRNNAVVVLDAAPRAFGGAGL
jgi:hypothetical protein